jgi:Ca-activated chloride channel family protein
MSSRWLLILALIAGGLTLSRTQDSPQVDLPSAPSATLQKKQPAPVPVTPSVPRDQTNKEGVPPTASGDLPSINSSAPTSETPASSEPPPTTFRRTVNEVNVVFTVTDKHGHYVKDLTQSEIKVIDDQKPALDVRSFHRETDLPLQVGLLVDASNSIRDRFKFEQQAAIEFLNSTIRPKYDQAFVVGFDVTPEVTQDFTDNSDALSVGVRGLRPGGGTAMYDAIYFACRDKLMKAPQSGPVRRAIVILSDGDDNQSHVTREEAVEMAQRAEVIIYAISTNINGSGSHGDKILERIADATGGRAFFPFQLREVSNAFAEIQNELRSQYALAYTPADLAPNGKYHSIEILAQDRKGLRVRSRHGYYAPTH